MPPKCAPDCALHCLYLSASVKVSLIQNAENVARNEFKMIKNSAKKTALLKSTLMHQRIK